MQAGRPAQPSAADSPSSSHPRKGFCEASRAFRFLRCTAARVAPEGVPGQAHIHEPRGSAPRERDHRGGDHPVPSRTRQLSPPSPRVLQRQAAGGQGVALAEGAFLFARERPRRPAGPAGGSSPPRALLRYGASMRAGSFCVRGRLLLRAGLFCGLGPAACGLVLRSGGGRRFLHAGPFLVQGGACSFGCSLHLQGTSPECDLRMSLEFETRSRGSPCFLAGCELARFAAVGGCVAPCFIVTHIASRLLFIRPASMEYLALSGSTD